MDILREHLKAERGRLTRLAETLKISSSAILQWPRVPAERVVKVSDATGLSLSELRPDMFGPPPKPAAKKRSRAA